MQNLTEEEGRPNGPTGYTHPTLGKITEYEVHLIKWDREVRAEMDPKIEKLNEIIELVNQAYADWMDDMSQIPFKEIIEKLEKFRDEEL